MHSIVQELDSIVKKGAGLLADFESDTFRLQQWLIEREAIFSHLTSGSAKLTKSDRQAVIALSEAILALDATILPRLEARLHSTGKEILATRKLKQLIGNATHSESSLLRRGI